MVTWLHMPGNEDGCNSFTVIGRVQRPSPILRFVGGSVGKMSKKMGLNWPHRKFDYDYMIVETKSEQLYLAICWDGLPGEAIRGLSPFLRLMKDT